MSAGSQVDIIRTPLSWIEGAAEVQLSKVAELPGMIKAVGMPDLHPGKGGPVGAAFLADSIVYPYLVGSDIGCGMSMFKTDVKAARLKLQSWERRLRTGILEGSWDGDTEEWLADYEVLPSGHESALGTIGGGNHFAEWLKVKEIVDADSFEQLGLDAKRILLLIHSGSRGFGAQILRQHVDEYTDAGLSVETSKGREYLQQHDHAVAWAKVNRALIAHRIADALGIELSSILDVVHNFVEYTQIGEIEGWLHRKGATPSDQGVVAIPGSRGAYTYLVQPLGDGQRNMSSLAHGAGRRWKRSGTKARLENRFQVSELQRTDLGSRVICDDKNLLYEEAPPAYKSIDDVVEALVSAGAAKVVAILTPVLTYKKVRVE